MSIFPVKDLAQYGVITDPDPYTLPPNAWSAAVNVRFQNKKVSRGPVFRNVHALQTANPRFVVGQQPNSGQDLLFVGYENGHVVQLDVSDGTETDVSIAGWSGAVSDSIWTTTTLANVLYVNQADRTPWFMRTGDTDFQDLQLTSFTASITSNVMTVTVIGAGALSVGQTVVTSGGNTTITSLGSGSGGTGTYNVATIANQSSQTMTAYGSDTNASTMWPSNWTCGLLRSCGGALIALNVSKSGIQYPTMVCTSNFPQAGAPPSTFNTTVDTDATQNILPEFEGQIIDAATLGNNLFIYGNNEVWQGTLVGGTEVWDYVKVFDNQGAINANCVQEVNGLQYVFGPDDCWMHDGVTPSSICTDRAREFIFGGLNAAFVNRCMLYHDKLLKTLHFIYRSGDQYSQFVNSTDGCNRQAVYDYQRDSWTFDDLPLTYYVGRSNLDTTMQYDTVTATYETVGGSYQSQDATYKKSTVYVGDSSTAYGLTESLYGFDPSGPLSQLSFPIDQYANNPSLLERDGIDLNQVGADLKGYKICQSIFPQGRLDPNAAALEFSFGAADYFNETPTYAASNPQTWDGESNYKLDFGIAGRYLTLEMTAPGFLYFDLSALDLDLDVLAER